jgi:hypothetical protein
LTAPLYLDLLPRGEADFDGAVQYLSQTRGTEYAELYTERFGEVIVAACQRVADEIADNGKPFDRTHEAASLQFAQPVYRVKVSLSRTRSRGSSAGLWYVFYALEERSTSLFAAPRGCSSDP